MKHFIAIATTLGSAVLVVVMFMFVIPAVCQNDVWVLYYKGCDFNTPRWVTVRSVMKEHTKDRPCCLVPSDGFSSRWSSWLMVPTNDTYTFATLSDGGIRLYLDGRLLIDNWRDQGWKDSARTTNLWLEAGEHAMLVEYYDRVGVAAFLVQWTGGGIPPKTPLGAPYLRKRWSFKS